MQLAIKTVLLFSALAYKNHGVKCHYERMFSINKNVSKIK